VYMADNKQMYLGKLQTALDERDTKKFLKELKYYMMYFSSIRMAARVCGLSDGVLLKLLDGRSEVEEKVVFALLKHLNLDIHVHFKNPEGDFDVAHIEEV